MNSTTTSTATGMGMELADRHMALANQFNALANVANREVREHVRAGASTGTSLVFGAGAGASMAYFGNKAGTAINAGIAVAGLLATLMYNDKADVVELGHAVARGLGAGSTAVGVYEATHNWIASGPARAAEKNARVAAAPPPVPQPAPPPRA